MCSYIDEFLLHFIINHEIIIKIILRAKKEPKVHDMCDNQKE
jgi:hypothetical protein